MGRTVRLLGIAVTIGLALASATACEPAPPAPSKVSGTVPIACASFTYDTPVDWYLPAGTPKGLVWMQHGFTETKADWTELATKAGTQGFAVMATTLPTADLFGCTVQNLGNNTAYLNNVANLFASTSAPLGALSKSWALAANRAGRSGLALPTAFTFIGHSAGGEAVLYVANRLRTAHPTTFAKLKGLVLEDPVKSFAGDNTGASLTGLNGTTLPIYALAGPNSSCNADQSGTKAVSSLLTTRPFHGSLVTTGTHGDVFGGSVPGTVKLACGTPKAADTAAVQKLTLAWTADQLAGAKDPANYPGGATYQALVAAGTISTLP